MAKDDITVGGWTIHFRTKNGFFVLLFGILGRGGKINRYLPTTTVRDMLQFLSYSIAAEIFYVIN